MGLFGKNGKKPPFKIPSRRIAIILWPTITSMSPHTIIFYFTTINVSPLVFAYESLFTHQTRTSIKPKDIVVPERYWAVRLLTHTSSVLYTMSLCGYFLWSLIKRCLCRCCCHVLCRHYTILTLRNLLLVSFDSRWWHMCDIENCCWLSTYMKWDMVIVVSRYSMAASNCFS